MAEILARLRSKVVSIAELIDIARRHRMAGLRVVLAGGCFDLLHPGHIDHLEQARCHGDVLMVAVTADDHVNKGPSRPAFPEAVRAEQVAALGCVDYVIVNPWPTAVPLIKELLPDVYVKGSEYRDQVDVTGGIDIERQAVESMGGRLAFTEGVTHSSSALVNRHLDLLSPETRAYLAEFQQRHTVDEVLGWLDAIRDLKVLVVGEAITDEYQFVEAIGKAAKDPMLAVRHLRTERYEGGAGAVAEHAASFVRDLLQWSQLASPELGLAGEPTILKRRIIDEYTGTKLLEVYEQGPAPSEEARFTFRRGLMDMAHQGHLVLVVDYGHGLLDDDSVGLICDDARFLAVNTQSNAGNLGYHAIGRWPRADYVCLAENEIRLEARDRSGDLRGLVTATADQLHCERMVVTRGSNGALCWSRSEGFHEVPALAGQVVDRVGAGDAFLAITSLLAAKGCPMDILGLIGNAASAQAVGTMGNEKPVDRVALIKHLKALLA